MESRIHVLIKIVWKLVNQDTQSLTYMYKQDFFQCKILNIRYVYVCSNILFSMKTLIECMFLFEIKCFGDFFYLRYFSVVLSGIKIKHKKNTIEKTTNRANKCEEKIFNEQIPLCTLNENKEKK